MRWKFSDKSTFLSTYLSLVYVSRGLPPLLASTSRHGFDRFPNGIYIRLSFLLPVTLRTDSFALQIESAFVFGFCWPRFTNSNLIALQTGYFLPLFPLPLIGEHGFSTFVKNLSFSNRFSIFGNLFFGTRARTC